MVDYDDWIKGQSFQRIVEIQALTELFQLDPVPAVFVEGDIKVVYLRNNRGKIVYRDEELMPLSADDESEEDESDVEAAGSVDGDEKALFDQNLEPIKVSRVPLPPFANVE